MPQSSQVPGRFDIGTSSVAVRRQGTGSPSAVFISGRGDSGRVWQPVIERLRASTSVITYDRPGCGDSDNLPTSESQVPQPSSWAAHQLATILRKAAAPAPYVLVGHSLGGQIADAFAVQYPRQVSGLVLIDAVDPELQLATQPPHPVIDDAADDRAGHGWLWDVAASAGEYRTSEPDLRPPTVVVASAIWRWFQAKTPERYWPLTLAAVDQRWQRAQLDYALRWHGHLVVAHDAGHRVHQDAPALVAVVIDNVMDAVRAGTQVRLDTEGLNRAGGSLRVPASAMSGAATPIVEASGP